MSSSVPIKALTTMMLLLVATCGRAMDVKLMIDSRVVRVIDRSQFLSFNFDTTFIRGDFCGINWERAVILARALAPCYLRVGGTNSAYMIFEEGDTGKATNEPPLTHGCSMFDTGNFLLTHDQFDRLNWFAQTAGMRFMFDLNGVYDRKNGKWDTFNQRRLLNYANEMKYVLDFELGNEPDLYSPQHNITSQQLVKDFRDMRAILNSLPMYKQSKLMGPAVATPTNKDMYQHFLEEGGLNYVDAVTFHHYYGNGLTSKLDFFIDPNVLDHFPRVLDEAMSMVAQNTMNGSRMRPVWLGETASTYHAGTAGISNSYAAGFMWLDKLALCALTGIEAVFRQTFYMGNYALTDEETSPRPDYWLSLLFRTIVGEQVLNASTNLAGNLTKFGRFYAHQNDSHFMLFGMNLLANESMNVFISGYAGPVVQFLLEPKDNVLIAKQVLLNGHPLTFDGHTSPSTGILNMGIIVTQPIVVPSLRYGFWMWPKTPPTTTTITSSTSSTTTAAAANPSLTTSLTRTTLFPSSPSSSSPQPAATSTTSSQAAASFSKLSSMKIYALVVATLLACCNYQY